MNKILILSLSVNLPFTSFRFPRSYILLPLPTLHKHKEKLLVVEEVEEGELYYSLEGM